MKDENPRLRGVQIGAATAFTLWTLEVAAVAFVNADIGGWPILVEMAAPLAAWGLAYLLLGALSGALLGRHAWLAGLPWLVVYLLGDQGVAPPVLYLAVVAAGAVLGPLWGRLQRSWVPVVVAAVAMVALQAPWRSSPEPLPGGAGPDVVLIVIDTLRADHVGSYGYARDTTPVLDAFARGARRYTHARSNASWTLPAHASLFTGLLPAEHGATATHPLLVEQPTLASQLAERGYRTVGLSSNAWVGPGTGLDQGFHTFTFAGAGGVASQLLLPLAVHRPRDLGGERTTRGALRALARDDAPLFLFLNYLEAHEPLGTVPRSELDRFSEQALDPTLGRVWIRDMARFWCSCDGPAGELGCADGVPVAPEARIRGSIDRYDAGIHYIDTLVGEVLAAVDDDAIVIVTSDHGELLGEYGGRLGHMVTLEPELLDVPLLIRAPGLPAGVDDAVITLADLPGQILAWVDRVAPPSTHGWAVAEVHPHTQQVTGQWERFFGCDCAKARQFRRVVWDGTRSWQLGDLAEGQAAERLARPFATGEAATPDIPALRALGYVQ